MRGIAERNLFCQPVTTSPSPIHHGVVTLLGDLCRIHFLFRADFGVEHIGALKKLSFSCARHQTCHGHTAILQFGTDGEGENVMFAVPGGGT